MNLFVGGGLRVGMLVKASTRSDMIGWLWHGEIGTKVNRIEDESVSKLCEVDKSLNQISNLSLKKLS